MTTLEIRLQDCPQDVNNFIVKEQERLAFFDNKRLKKHEVVYHMIREWTQYKNEGKVLPAKKKR